MKILVEASEVYRNNTGIGRFSREVIRHVRPYADLTFSPCDVDQRVHNPGQRTTFKRFKHFADHLWLTQAEIVTSARREHPDLIHCLSFFAPLMIRKLPIVVTIFDLAYFDIPHHTDAFWSAYGRSLMPTFARSACAIVTTSDVMSERIAARFHIAPERIHRIYGGVDARFHPVDSTVELERVRAKFDLREPFALYVGAWHDNKNLKTLLAAFAPIRSAQLVITGLPHSAAEAELRQLAESLGVRTRFIGYVADTDLPTLYSLAHCVVQPSLYEGFGLPVVEAMACGAPVLVSDIAVLREIGGDAVLRFPAQHADSLYALLTHVLESSSEREELRLKSLARARLFSWDAAAHEIVDVWRTL